MNAQRSLGRLSVLDGDLFRAHNGGDFQKWGRGAGPGPLETIFQSRVAQSKGFGDGTNGVRPAQPQGFLPECFGNAAPSLRAASPRIQALPEPAELVGAIYGPAGCSQRLSSFTRVGQSRTYPPPPVMSRTVAERTLMTGVGKPAHLTHPQRIFACTNRASRFSELHGHGLAVFNTVSDHRWQHERNIKPALIPSARQSVCHVARFRFPVKPSDCGGIPKTDKE